MLLVGKRTGAPFAVAVGVTEVGSLTHPAKYVGTNHPVESAGGISHWASAHGYHSPVANPIRLIE